MLQCLAAIVNYTAFCLYYSLWSQIDKSIYGCFHMTGEKLPYARKTTHFHRLRGVVHPFFLVAILDLRLLEGLN